jgi:hypothetical protein
LQTTDHQSQSRPLALSQRLAQIVATEGPDLLTFSELATQLHARAWGGLLFIFAAINVLPLPPGTSAFFALPIVMMWLTRIAEQDFQGLRKAS